MAMRLGKAEIPAENQGSLNLQVSMPYLLLQPVATIAPGQLHTLCNQYLNPDPEGLAYVPRF